MPCGYHVSLEDGLVTVTGADQLDPQQLVALGKQILADPSFHPKLPHLVDLRGLLMTLDPESDQSMKTFFLKSYRSQVRSSIAIVVDDSLDTSIMASLFHVTCAMEKTELFDQYDQALKWLMRREFAPANPPGAWRSLP